MNLKHVISLLQILVWIASPLLILQQGEIYAAHPGLEEAVDDIMTREAVQTVDIKSLQPVDIQSFESFLSSHGSLPAEDGSGHYHTSFDGCCGLGGVVCDAAMVSNLRSTQNWITGNHIDWGNFFYAGIDVPTLRHPPKPLFLFNHALSIIDRELTVRASWFGSN